MSKFYFIIIAFVILNSCSTVKKLYLGIPGVVKVANDTIYLQSGEISIYKTFSIPDGMTLKGNNTTLTFKYLDAYPIIKLNGSKNITLNGIRIKGEPLKMGKYPTSYYFWLERNNFIQIHNSFKITLENCEFENSYGSVIHVSDSHNLIFKKCKISEVGLTTHHTYNYSYDGIILSGNNSTTNVLIDSCSFYNIGSNFPLHPESYANDGDGVHLQSSAGSKLENIKISNCTFNGCSARCVKIQNGKFINITNNKFINSGSGVVMAIVEPIYNIDLSNNYHENVAIPYSSETMGPSITVYDLTINNNHVKGLCNWFMRTGGGSNVENGVFNNNVIEDSGMHAFAGRFFKSSITNNKILSFGSRNHIYHMALEIAPECYDLIIENNYFGRFAERNFEMTNYSKNNTVIVRNNTVEMSKTKREKN